MNALESKAIWRMCNRLSDALEEVQEVLSELMEFEAASFQRAKKAKPVVRRKRAAVK